MCLWIAVITHNSLQTNIQAYSLRRPYLGGMYLLCASYSYVHCFCYSNYVITCNVLGFHIFFPACVYQSLQLLL